MSTWFVTPPSRGRLGGGVTRDWRVKGGLTNDLEKSRVVTSFGSWLYFSSTRDSMSTRSYFRPGELFFEKVCQWLSNQTFILIWCSTLSSELLFESQIFSKKIARSDCCACRLSQALSCSSWKAQWIVPFSSWRPIQLVHIVHDN